jgi:phage shock protein E
MKHALKVLFAGLLLCAQAAYAEPVWIDVRSAEEYASDHIDGDANVPLAEIDAQALADKYGKDAELMLYCRSGNRAGQALEILKSAGFSKVSNAGGIADVRTLRGLAVQSPAATEPPPSPPQ